MTTYKAIQVSKKGGPFELVEKPLVDPPAGHVLINVKACGICRGDDVVYNGFWPNIQYPRVPGHEVAGVVHKVGAGVNQFKPGQRVAVGWHGGHCWACSECKRGDVLCCDQGKICGIHYDGGYAEYTTVPQEAIALIPDELSFEEAAPLVCAGLTVFNGLRNSVAKPGDTVAILGIGGLGHLAIQFAAKMGYKTVAYTNKNKAELAKQLGAALVIDTASGNLAQELQKIGGAKVIVATSPSAKQASEAINGLSTNGELLVVGVDAAPIQIPAGALIHGNRKVKGWASGAPWDSEDTMKFAVLNKVKSMNEVYPFEKAAEAYERMKGTDAKFRVVLKMD